MPGPDASAPLAVDHTLGGRYRLIGPIARGGMAEVWEGYDEILARPVAVKVLLRHLATDEVVRERFRREAVTAARLAHPNVVATYDTGVDGGVAYIVMELVRGQTLRHLLASRGQLPVPVALSVADQIADALAHAHRAGLVHRDIKPANVLLADEEGPLPRIKVTDFGIAKAAASVGVDLTSTGMVLGTPKYLSPEQVEGREPDARADLYALGVVLYEMLAGVPPFAGPTEMATALAHLRDTAPRISTQRPGVPAALDDVVAVLLAKDPAGRYASAGDLRHALAAIPRPSGATPPRGSSPQGATTAVLPRSGPAPTGVLPSGPAAGNGLGVTSAIAGALGGGGEITARSQTSRRDAGGWPPPRNPTVRNPTVRDPTVRAPTVRDTTARDSTAGSVRGAPPMPNSRLGDVAAVGPGVRGAAHAPAPPPPSRRRRRRRRGPGIVVLALVVAGGVVAAVLLTRPAGHASGAPGSSSTAPLPLVAARVFVLAGHTADDPSGAANVLDNNPATVWRTVQYTTAHFGNLYPGIGIAVQLSGTRTLHTMSVAAPAGGWSAQAYVASSFPSTSASVGVWGAPTDTKSATGTTTRFSLGGRSGSWVLLWLTLLPGPAPYQTAIADITVS